ncbi:MAG TPA: hypothetical protein VFP14_04295, partial [Novosphingobium sp.]|nr:hypothetical protein [Novosphingobium sp.]
MKFRAALLDKWPDWLLVPVFLLFFTTRLVPEPVSDRSIYQSVAERMLAGDRLYVDVIDNKDPLFYYAVAAQRLLGPLAEYGFELVCVFGSATITAALARRLFSASQWASRLVLVGMAFVLTGPLYDLGGSIPPGIFLSLLTIWLAISGRPIIAGIALATLLFTKLIYAPIALAFVVVHSLAQRREGREGASFLLAFALACTALSAAILLALFARGELPGYLASQRANLLYAHSNVFVARGMFDNLRYHVLTALYFGKRALAISVLACAFLAWDFLRTSPEDPRRAFLAASLAIYPVSLAIVGFTAIWCAHLAVLHIFLALAASAVVPRLLRDRPVLALPLVIGVAWLLSGLGPDPWEDSNPLDFGDRLDALAAPSPEAVALHRVAGPGSIRYARLGSDNDFHHASGTHGDRLVCPHFFQYRFTEASLLDSIVACAS